MGNETKKPFNPIIPVEHITTGKVKPEGGPGPTWESESLKKARKNDSKESTPMKVGGTIPSTPTPPKTGKKKWGRK